MLLIYALAFVVSVLSTCLATWYLRNFAVRHGFVCSPASDRHLHKTAVPRIGGVAIYSCFVAIISVLLLVVQLMHRSQTYPPIYVLYVLLPGTMIYCLGLYDDFHNAGPALKFGIQALAAAVLYAGGFRVFEIRLFHLQNFGWLVSLPATIFWVLLITNAFNLIDGLDGLAAGAALFSTLTVFVLSLASHNGLMALATICLAGCILGFLRFNFNPASIFLGDSGSLFLGFVLSALALAGAQKTPTTIAVAIPVVSFGLPIIDTAVAVFRRFLSGKPLFTGDRQHIHHRLLQRGLSQRQAVLVLYAVSGVLGMLSLFLLYPGGESVALVMLVLGAGVLLGVQQLGYHEFFELGRLARRTFDQKTVIVNNLAIRRAIDMISGAASTSQLKFALEAAFAQNDFDGFELVLTAQCLGTASDAVEQRFSWHKTGSGSAMAGAGWWITLQLGDGRRQFGYLSMFRLNADRPLLVNIEILTRDLRDALRLALARISSSATEPVAAAISLSSHVSEKGISHATTS